MYKVDNYILGLLYGDGHFLAEYRHGWYFFSTTHKEISDKVKEYLDKSNVKYFSFTRDYHSEDLKNYELLEVVEITDRNFISFLTDNGFRSNDVKERVKWNGDFIRGYLETKGTIFPFKDKNSTCWRVSFSGSRDEMEYLKYMFEVELDMTTHKVVRRKEREWKGVISESYRLNIQSRDSIAKLVGFCSGGNISEYLKENFDRFNQWHSETPFNMKRKVFKHYKYAVAFMSRDLGITVKGVRGGGGSWKPVYLWEGDTKKEMYEGWVDAYNKIKKLYKEETGFNPPMVKEE